MDVRFIKHHNKEELLLRLLRQDLAQRELRLRTRRKKQRVKLFELSKRKGFQQGLRLLEQEIKRTAQLPFQEYAKETVRNMLKTIGDTVAVQFPDFLISKIESLIPKLPEKLILAINPNLQLNSSLPTLHDESIPLDTVELRHSFGTIRYSISKEMMELL
jgi:hypothetical protein